MKVICLLVIFGAGYLLVSEKNYESANCISFYGAECQEKNYTASKNAVIAQEAPTQDDWIRTADNFSRTYKHMRGK